MSADNGTLIKTLREDAKIGIHNEEDALKDIYKRMRPGDPPTVINAKQMIHKLFFELAHYDLGYVGRHKINKKLGLSGRVPEELRTLRTKNLSMVYMGLESGCDEVLRRMKKGNTAADIVAAGQKVREAGMALSVTAISGLGGQELWQEHALETAAAFSAMRPEYIGILTLMVEPGTPLFDWVRRGDFHLLESSQVLEETALLVGHLDAPGSVFRMNHASNYLNLRGTLNRDREALLATIHAALHGEAALRPETWRAL